VAPATASSRAARAAQRRAAATGASRSTP
jgi:hypothetical protein